MPYLDLPAIKREIPLKMVLDHVGWKPSATKDGEQRGRCPLHNSSNKKSRSFAVKDEGWYCHTCKTGGDCFRLWCMFHQVSLMQAVRQMCETFKVPEYQLPRHLWNQQRRNGEEERL